MTPRTALRVAALLGFLAVALGAFGAHALRPVLEKHQTAAIWQTASFYHFAHTLVLLFLAFQPKPSKITLLLFVSGIMIFSGSLYLLAVTGFRSLGIITPLGGLFLMAGWLFLFFQKPPRE